LRRCLELSSFCEPHICHRFSPLQCWHNADGSKSAVRFDGCFCRGAKRRLGLRHRRGLLFCGSKVFTAGFGFSTTNIFLTTISSLYKNVFVLLYQITKCTLSSVTIYVTNE